MNIEANEAVEKSKIRRSFSTVQVPYILSGKESKLTTLKSISQKQGREGDRSFEGSLRAKP